MALTGSEDASRLSMRAAPRSLWSRLKARVGDAEHLLVQRLAGTVFLVRVAGAALAFGSQVLLARWMGSFEFGIYVYVWTWVLLLGNVIDFGLGTAAQRFIPEYRKRGLLALLRGFVSGSRWLAFVAAILLSVLCAGLVRLLEPWLDHYLLIPLYLACVMVPAYAIGNVQDGIARSYDWFGLAMVPGYIVRQLLLTVLMAAAYLSSLPMNAVTAMIVTAASVWLPTLAQLLIVNRRLGQRIEPGPKTYDFRVWLTTALPILMVEGFYAMLAYTDILVLQLFRPPDEVAVYYAAAKTLALVAFVHYSIAATTAHRFSGYHVAGDRQAPVGVPGPGDQVDILAVAGGDRGAAAVRAADPRPVRRAIHRRLSPHVHPGRRPPGARRDRSDRAAAQHAGRAAPLRPGLCRRLRAQSRTLLRPHSAVRRGRCRALDRDRADHRIDLFVRGHQEPARLPRLHLASRRALEASAVHGTIESQLRVEWRPLAELTPVAAEWRTLAARALEPNVFYEPSFALAAQPVLGRDVGAILVWSRASPPRLLGLFPARIERRRYGVGLPVLVGWTHPYGPLGTPLIDRELAEDVLTAWLDHLASDPQLPRLVLMRYFPVDGALARAFDAALARRHGRSVEFARHARALLAPGRGAGRLSRAGDRSEKTQGAAAAASPPCRWRGGDVEQRNASSTAALHALDDFLALEAGGWKGRAGTAARSQAEVRTFMEGAVVALAREGKARIDRLTVGRTAGRRHRDLEQRHDGVVLEGRL